MLALAQVSRKVLLADMGGSINRGPQNGPKYILVLIIGTAQKGTIILTTIHINHKHHGPQEPVLPTVGDPKV